jgi:SAM-dependent methyltransferase
MAYYVGLYASNRDDSRFRAARIVRELVSIGRAKGLPIPPPVLRTSDQRIVSMVHRFVDRKAAVIDWGAGRASLARKLAKCGYNVTTVEISGELVKALSEAGLRSRLSDDLDDVGGGAAVVILTEVLEHLVDPAALLRELHRRYPRAVIMASVPSPRRTAVRRNRLETWEGPPNHLSRFSLVGLQSLFERSGYSAELVLPHPRPLDLVPPGWTSLPSRVRGALSPWAKADRDCEYYPGRWVAAATLWCYWLYMWVGRAVFCAPALYARLSGDSGRSVVVVGNVVRS